MTRFGWWTFRGAWLTWWRYGFYELRIYLRTLWRLR